MPLTNIQVEKAKPREKNWKLFDEKGLYLLVSKDGHRQPTETASALQTKH